MTDTTSTPYGRAECPVCGRKFNLTKSGTMRNHVNQNLRVNGWNQVCEGVGRAPGVVTFPAAAPADDDTRAVRMLTTAVNQLISGWAESSPERKRELWQAVGDRNDALFDRFHERFSDLDRRFAAVPADTHETSGT